LPDEVRRPLASDDFSAAAADAPELRVQQLFSFIRCSLDVTVITAAVPASELGLMHAALAKSVTAAKC
jgi:hypothetical protein